MISHLRGRMIEKSPTHVILECNGVGYHLEVSLHTFSGLSSEEEQFLYTHLQIKEDSHTLFGFLSEFERAVFRLLISVSGVGAATARTMLSSLNPSDVVGAIASEQVAVVQSVKGIGAKTAQRMILELKDKVLALEGAEDLVTNTTVKGHMSTGAEIRAHCRTNDFTRQTSGLAPGYVQCNVIILPAQDAEQFAAFCKRNPQPCPLLATSRHPGAADLPELGDDIDIRTDLPRYRIWEHGQCTGQRDDILDLWQDDWVAFALGCSFSFEEALSNAGIEIRNVSEGVNVPMYRTNIDCQSAGPFEAKMVVSMRPMPASDAITAIQICSRYPSVHGAPIHLGDPELIGIADLNQPDFGDPVSVRANEIPLFWACGVTPQVALESAELPLAITHEPGHMLVTDLKNASLEGEASWNA